MVEYYIKKEHILRLIRQSLYWEQADEVFNLHTISIQSYVTTVN